MLPQEVIRATETEKQHQIQVIENLHKANRQFSEREIQKLKDRAIQNENIFEQLMEATKTCSLGQITAALFEVGGQYRRNM